MIVLFLVGGIIAYKNIGRLEDPEFTIKSALVYTSYPGASPKEVEEEVTDKIEIAAHEIGKVKKLKSYSRAGFSEVEVVIQDKYKKDDLPQIWDELRRKINDVQPELPPGAGPSIVYDDYGDVYGMYYAVVGDGFDYKSLKYYTDTLKRELSLVPGVGKVTISGIQEQAIFVDISRGKMSQLGISLDQIYQTLASQNLATYAGNVKIGSEYIRIVPTGYVDSVKDIGNLVIRSNTSKKLFHLSDIATITRGYQEVQRQKVYFNGNFALTMGISVVSGGNVVKIGGAVAKKVKELLTVIPVGVEIHPIYQQPAVVTEAVNGFVISFIEALAIVIIVLFLFMGVRSGLIISAQLFLTIFATIFFMYIFGISLERISLGALIIALGMLVDNAIVVTDGMQVKIEAGVERLKAAVDVVNQQQWPLLGATVIGVLAFSGIGLSQDSTGEYTLSLFLVILISLLLSWWLAVSVGSLFGYHYLKKPKNIVKDPYDKKFFHLYRHLLSACISRRWLTLILMVGLLASSIYAFQYVKDSFFPDSTTPVFLIDYWLPQGTDIRENTQQMLQIQKDLRQMEGITDVTTVIGTGADRFTLVYTPDKPNSSYGQFLVRVDDYRKIDRLIPEARNYLISHFPDSDPKIKRIKLGPGEGAKVEVRVSGPDSTVLRKLSEDIKNIMSEIPNTTEIRDNWRSKEKVLVPDYSETQARLTGITRRNLSEALETAFTGTQVGVYREGTELIPIVSRPPDNERLDINNIDDLQIWSPLLKQTVPLGQVVSSFMTQWEDALIWRYNRRPTITVACEPLSGPASVIMSALAPKIKDLKLPPGYRLEWGGEYESSTDAQSALVTGLIISFLMMFLIIIFLFNGIKQAVMIWLCVPLSFIGVSFGLLITRAEFGFMALLGFLSLTGMLIKNAIVLLDEIQLQISEGKEPYHAILDAAISRFRPVVLAALTTVLGMIPLLPDIFFRAMAVVIMFGLSFATVLTLLIIPTLYTIFYKIPSPSAA